jgi:iron complex outermembrane receptor protein
LSHTFLSGRLGETTAFSKYALNHLRHQVVAQAQIRVFEQFRLQVFSRYMERLTNGSYWVYDVRATAALKYVDLSVDVNNVLNETYVESGFVPMPGRMLRLSISWKWNRD